MWELRFDFHDIAPTLDNLATQRVCPIYAVVRRRWGSRCRRHGRCSICAFSLLFRRRRIHILALLEPLDGIQETTSVADLARAEERINNFKMYSAVLLGHESPAQAAENHELGCRSNGSSRSAGNFGGDNSNRRRLGADLVRYDLRHRCACTIQMGRLHPEFLAREEISRRRRTCHLARCDLRWIEVRSSARHSNVRVPPLRTGSPQPGNAVPGCYAATELACVSHQLAKHQG